MKKVDEDCYPIITTIDNDWRGRDTSDALIPTQKRRLISTELTNHTLLGCSHGRRWGYEGEMVEVRSNAGLYDSGSGFAHRINWDGNTIHAVNTSSSALRIIYMDNNNFNKGIFLSALGSFWWGFFGVIYFKYISFAGHIEVVIHRSLWTSVTLLLTTLIFSKWQIFFSLI